MKNALMQSTDTINEGAMKHLNKLIVAIVLLGSIWFVGLSNLEPASAPLTSKLSLSILMPALWNKTGQPNLPGSHLNRL